jgi:hypothetical protein
MTGLPPPLPASSDWDVPSTRVIVLALAAANAVFWLYTFRFISAHSNPKGDGFDTLPVMPFAAIFFALVVPATLRAIRRHGLGVALVLVLGASMLNAMVFLGVLGSLGETALTRREP